jgi:hypothetical protein
MAQDSRAHVYVTPPNPKYFEDEKPRLMLKEAGMSMELSDRYELMEPEF